MKRKTSIIICAIAAITAAGVMLYPLLSNFLAEKNKSIVETKYMRAVEELDTAEITEARAKAAEYNEMINSAVEKAYTKDAIKSASENYYDLLNIRGDGIMGYVEIPKILFF